VTSHPVGLGRRIIGPVFLGLGILLLADIFCWVIYWRGQYALESWLRFYVALWVGLLLVTAGWWLARRSRAALWGILLIVLAGIATCLSFLPADNPFGPSS
jgi:peptidoglycan/LPS O-acetylase OafA/YrhL